MAKQQKLIEIDYPDFGSGAPPAAATGAELEERIAALRAAMAAQRLTHMIVYGDREHFANLTYLTGFDPRFEEALLIVRETGKPLLVVGNECEGYMGVSPLIAQGKLRSERFQSFSLLNQPRGQSRQLAAILGDEGVHLNAKVGCAGWKYFSSAEHPAGRHAIDLPAYLVDSLRDLAGYANVVNATATLMNPSDGLRAICSANEIAAFEYSNVQASEGLKRMLLGLREGMSDFEVVQLAQINGLPLACHLTLITGSRSGLGMASPDGTIIRRGEPLATNLSYWGSNCCRAGWVAETAADLRAPAQEYVAAFAGPYFAALAEWFGLLRLGQTGSVLAHLIEERLPYAQFGIFLNPGHLIHLDEWLSSPIYAGSQETIRSGMVIQVDVIPSSPVYFSTRMEDGLAIADAALRQELAAAHPGCYARCRARRRFMQETLGIELPEEVLPLSNLMGIVPPFLLRPQTVLALR